MATTSVQREWARIGAQSRLATIEHERQAILKAFPELRRPGAIVSLNSLNGLPTPPPKRTFSAAARRRMSAGMRKFWARRKALARANAKTA